MNSLLVSINGRRVIMFVATGLFGIFTSAVFYQMPISSLAFWDPINTGVMGLLIFEFLYRTKRWLSLKTIGVYIIIVVLVSQWLYFALFKIEYKYGAEFGDLFSLEPFTYLFSTFPYIIFFVLESSIVVALAYYLIHFRGLESTIEVPNEMTRNQAISYTLIGVITASLGGTIKYILVMSGVELFAGGILLPFYLCLVTPILGALAGIGGASMSRNRNLGAFIGGAIIVLLFLPVPYISQ